MERNIFQEIIIPQQNGNSIEVIQKERLLFFMDNKFDQNFAVYLSKTYN